MTISMKGNYRETLGRRGQRETTGGAPPSAKVPGDVGGGGAIHRKGWAGAMKKCWKPQRPRMSQHSLTLTLCTGRYQIPGWTAKNPH